MEATLTINAVNNTADAVNKVGQDLKKLDSSAEKAATTLRGRLSQSAQKAAADLKKIGKSGAELGKSLKEVGAKAAELAAKLTAATGALAYAFKSVFVDVAAQAERCGFLLKTALGDELGSEALASVRAFASATGQELQAVTDSFLTLSRAGLKPTQDNLTALADLAAAHGKSMADVAKSFEGMIKGEVGGLEEFGVKSEQVGERLLLTYKNRQGEMVKLAAKANDPENLAKIMTKISADKAGGASAEQGKTFTGMVAKLQASWAEFRTMVMDSGPFAFIKEQLEGILEWVEKLKGDGRLQQMADEWGEKITEALKKIRDGLGKAYEFFKKWGPTIATVFNKLGGFKTVALAVGAAMGGPLVGALGKAGMALKTFGAALFGSPIGLVAAGVMALVAVLDQLGALEPMLEGFKEGFGALSDALGDAFKALLDSISDVLGSIGQNLTDVNGNINPQGWKDLGKAIGEFAGGTLTQLVKMLAEAVGFLDKLGSGIGIVAGKIVHGSVEDAERKSAVSEAVTERYVAARKAGDTAKMKELEPQMRAIAGQKDFQYVNSAERAAEGERAEANRQMMPNPALRRSGGPIYRNPAQAMEQKPKPQEVKTEVDVKVSGTVQQGIDVTASSKSPNTTVTDQTKQSMGFRPL